MCGRYYIPNGEEHREMMAIIDALNLSHPDNLIKTGDIFPTNTAPVFVAKDNQIVTEPFKWGFPNYQNKRVIINAKSETIEEKSMFKKSFINNRCIIPAGGFYEWDKNKTKYTFSLQDNPIFYMAGLYSVFQSENRFVILTTKANSSVNDVHDRMPVVMNKSTAVNWLKSVDWSRRILADIPPIMIKQFS